MAYASPVPKGQQPKPVHEMNNMASITDFLIFEEVKPVEDVDWSQPAVVSTYRTFDGLTLTITAVKDGTNTWVRVAAAESPRADGTEAFITENKGQDSTAGRIADQFIAADAVVATVEDLNKRLAPWAYRLTDYKSGKVTQRSADLLQAAGAKD